MDAIKAARELGKAIQADERFMKIKAAEAKNDSDIELQKMIADFNASRGELNTELQNAEKDEEKVKALNNEIKVKYAEIFENENMIEFSAAKEEFSELLNYVNQIVSGSASGTDPDTITDEQGCGGNCGGCSGCH